MDFVILGKKLKQARLASGRTQKEISQLLGVTDSNVSSWERGRSKIDIEMYVKICSIYGIDAIQPLAEAAESNLIHSLNDLSDVLSKGSISLSSTEQKIIESCRQMNEEGNEEVLKYAKILVSSSQYIKTNSSGLGNEEMA